MNPGIVHKDIDAPKETNSARYRFRPVGFFADVSLRRESTITNLTSARGNPVLINIHKNHGRAFPREDARRLSSHSSASTRNDSDFTSNTTEHCCLSL